MAMFTLMYRPERKAASHLPKEATVIPKVAQAVEISPRRPALYPIDLALLPNT
jgi:hypothetical protein